MDTGKIQKTDPDRKFRPVLTASSLTGDRVKNSAGEDLGKVHDIMLDLQTGRVAYVVLSFGGVLGMGNKLFAIPWNAIRINQDEKEFVLDVDKQRLENAPGFDKDNWPNSADETWWTNVDRYYGTGATTTTAGTTTERTYRGGGGV